MKQKAFFSFLVGIILATSSFVAVVNAQNYGLDETAKAAFGSLPTKDVQTTIGNILGTGLSMLSVVFFVLMIYGGILYMTARGKDEMTKKGIDTIWAAIIGIIIVLAAYALTNFVFQTVQGNVGGGAETTTTQTTSAITDESSTVSSPPTWCFFSAVKNEDGTQIITPARCQVYNFNSGESCESINAATTAGEDACDVAVELDNSTDL